MHAFDVLGDPVRRRVLELLAGQDLSSGDVVSVVTKEFGISQSAVSQHLKVLRNNGFATVTVDGARRVYALDTEGLQEVDAWLAMFRQFWAPKFEALATEVARGKRQRSKRKK
ncbi:MAG: metalloregulator ArsR/SmtB family transcription factor [Pseudomonadota bacterium]